MSASAAQLRDYRLLSSTIGLCPHCLARLDAKIVTRDGKVFIQRCCPRHGMQLDLLEEDLDYYLIRDEYAKPATCAAVQTSCEKQCPFDCGLCPNHEQHSCIGFLEITNACNCGCPACYASSGGDAFLPLRKFEEMLDFAIESEGGSLEILQISGGEPTLHPELLEMIQLARTKKVQTILLNTNGLALAENSILVEKLAAFQTGFEVYLQFDGLSESTHRSLRGGPLLQQKLRALDLLSRHGVSVTLVASMAAGVNEQEIGPLVLKGIQTPHVRGISFQPVAFFGRLPAGHVRRLDRMTITGVMRRLETQMKQMIRAGNFIPLPCDVDRVAVAYFLKNADGSIEPLVSRKEVQSSPVRNTLRFNHEDFAALRRKAVASCGPECCSGIAEKILQMLPRSRMREPNADFSSRVGADRVFRILITSFVDAYNFDLRSMQRECVHVITPDLRKIPFSAFNMVHRTQQQFIA